jgi:hypothetical protein
MSGGDWWSSDYNDGSSSDGGAQTGQDDNAQTGTAADQWDQSTTYSPPGYSAPIDQYNYVANPQSAGGYDTYGPGQQAPDSAASFSNTSGQMPDSASMAQAMANNQMDYSPTITADGSATSGMTSGFYDLSQADQQTWMNQYGQAAAPYQWAQQAGTGFQSNAGFNALPADQQNTWYSVYGSDAPNQWQQQSQQNAAGGAGQGDFWWSNGLPWNQPGGYANTAAAAAAGTTGTPYGYGWIQGAGTPGYQVQINPYAMNVLTNPALQQQYAPGYIPGSGTYNQWNLASNVWAAQNYAPLFNAQGQNMAYGSGGPGDPTDGSGPQTDQQWVQGGRLFNYPGANLQGQWAPLASNYLRSDTPSGVGTARSPDYMNNLLLQAVNQGILTPTARGWSYIQQVLGKTPQQIGGAAPAAAAAQAQANGGAGGTGGAGGQGPMGPNTDAFNYQAHYLDYLTAMMNNVSIPQLQNQNQQFHDELAFNQAKEKYLEQYQAQVFGEGQRQFNALQTLREAQTSGMYNGAPTEAARQFNQTQALDYLKLLGTLRGPGDIFQYMKVLGGTPGGMRDLVNAAAGAYAMPSSGGGAQVNYQNPSDISTLLSQMNNPNFGQEGQNLNLPAPNQINALNFSRMAPSQRQALLAAYENAGYNPNDIMAIIQNSMPQYQAPQAGRVSLLGR